MAGVSVRTERARDTLVERTVFPVMMVVVVVVVGEEMEELVAMTEELMIVVDLQLAMDCVLR
jgi:hypothetical protein